MTLQYNDEPTLTDELDRADMIRRLGDAIAECKPPRVFGIHGLWGSGKTSFLYELQLYLTGVCRQADCADEEDGATKAKQFFTTAWKRKPNVTCVWFPAWRYQHESAPVVALLHEIRTQLPLLSKAITEAGKLGEVALRGSLQMLDVLAKLIGVESIPAGDDIQQIGEQWEERHLASRLPCEAVQRQLEYEIKRLLRGGDDDDGIDHRLVVLIDDLDRCDYKAVYRLLEGIKIYLNLKNCAFVLAMDPRSVIEAFDAHLERGLNEKDRMRRAQEYVEKIYQDPWRLPIIDLQTRIRFLKGMLEDSALEIAIVGVAEKYSFLPDNPRKIKAFAALLRRYVTYLTSHKKVGKGAAIERQAGLVLVLAYAYQYHEPLYRAIERNPAFYSDVERWAAGLSTGHPVLTGLRRPLEPRSADNAPPEAEPELEPTYVAEDDREVFLLQPLVVRLRKDKPVKESEVERLLIDRPIVKASNS